MELNDMRVRERDLEFLKAYFSTIIHSYEDGACFFITDLEKVVFKLFNKFNLPSIVEGQPFTGEGIAAQVLLVRKTTNIQIDRNVYGIRIQAFGGPVWNEADNEIIGTWGLAIPRQHKIVNAFDSFAAALTELLPEGGLLYVSDKEKMIKRQGSRKFDVQDIQVNTLLRSDSVTIKSQQQKELIIEETDTAIYGVPTMVAASPLIIEESGEVVGSFGLILPRQLASDLKKIAGSLEEGLTGVSASVQQITAATVDVSNNQSRLHEEIQKVKEYLEDINNVMGFIKDIADETKMLGLNAAIEAARVGEAGQGFGVVAEEIRKLSEESKKTVAQIRELTKNIDKAMSETSGASESTLAVTEETSAAIQEVNATVEEITSLAGKLANTAANI